MRSTVGSRSTVAAALVAAVVVGVASLAFACTPGGEVYIDTPSGTAGSQPTLTGSSWGAHEASVEIRWNSMSGPVLAQVNPINGSFSVAVTIPQATPGVYYIVAKSPTRATPARVAFEIVATRTTQSPTESPQTQTSASASANESTGSGGSGQTATNATGGDGSNTSSAPATQRFGPVAGSGAASTGGQTAPAGTETTQSSGAQSASAPVRAARTAPASATAQPASSATAGESAAAPGDLAPAPAEAVAEVSERTTSGDLASGFETGPSLVPGLNDDPTTSAPGSPLALGVGLLAGGLGTLFAGFAAAELRRRRVTAS